ncbi:hypothetical protein GOV11_04035 [Candidatus Woesearchaeota archaeon]|nr:hypothetical protein [Candidatus Woesearchaeota archaeon]
MVTESDEGMGNFYANDGVTETCIKRDGSGPSYGGSVLPAKKEPREKSPWKKKLFKSAAVIGLPALLYVGWLYPAERTNVPDMNNDGIEDQVDVTYLGLPIGYPLDFGYRFSFNDKHLTQGQIYRAKKKVAMDALDEMQASYDNSIDAKDKEYLKELKDKIPFLD